MKYTIVTAAIVALAFPSSVSAHDAICGQADATQRLACHIGYVKARVAERYDVRSGHNRTVELSVTSSAAMCGDHSFCGRFKATYYLPYGFHSQRKCSGFVRIHAHTGQIIRIRDSKGRVLTDKSKC